jgi:hypothetical protein
MSQTNLGALENPQHETLCTSRDILLKLNARDGRANNVPIVPSIIWYRYLLDGGYIAYTTHRSIDSRSI